MEKLKWEKPWGPKKFRETIEWLVKGVNKRTPLNGTGIEVDEKPDGSQISVSVPKTGDKLSDGGSGGSGGTRADLYGALNGQPAVFHVFVSSPATPL